MPPRLRLLTALRFLMAVMAWSIVGTSLPESYYERALRASIVNRMRCKSMSVASSDTCGESRSAGKRADRRARAALD